MIFFSLISKIDQTSEEEQQQQLCSWLRSSDVNNLDGLSDFSGVNENV